MVGTGLCINGQSDVRGSAKHKCQQCEPRKAESLTAYPVQDGVVSVEGHTHKPYHLLKFEECQLKGKVNSFSRISFRGTKTTRQSGLSGVEHKQKVSVQEI
jgi:hypothetical protein